MTRLAWLSVLLVATLGVACAPSPQPSASPSPAAQVQPSPPPTVTPTQGVATAAPTATPSPSPAAIATPCAICSKLGGYDAAGFCWRQECLFRPTYGDRDTLVGVATLTGYYTRIERLGWGQSSAVCDSFVIVGGPSELIRLTLAQVDRGNSLNSKNAANQPVVSIDLGALTTLEANQIRASTARDPVTLVVVAHGLLRPGPPLCYSQYDIVRVSGATPSPNGQTALPTPKPPAISLPLDFAFVDSRNGWLLGAASGQTVLYKTADGGETWRPLNVPLTRPSFFDSERWSLSSQPTVGQIRFMNQQDGWLYGSSLFATHDGGQTWTDAHRFVGALELGGEAAWAIEQASGRMVVLRSIDAGRTWTPTSAQPDLKSAPSLAVFDAKTAWILNSDPLVMRSGLLATSDGGATWREKALPFDGCPSPFVIVDGDRRLWFVCGGIPATVLQEKSVYVSDDGGNSWELRASTGMAGPRAGAIAMAGHLLKSGRFAVASSARAFLALGRGTLMASFDGGSTWNEAISYAVANGGGDPAIGPVRFIDAQTGWVAVSPGRIFRTRDGGISWQFIDIDHP